MTLTKGPIVDTVTNSAVEGGYMSGTASAIAVTLLTGGVDRPYAYGLAMALLSKGVSLDVIGSDVVDSPEMHSSPNLRFYNLWPGRRRNATPFSRLSRTLCHYASLVRYAASAKPRVFHILWNSKVQFIDRTLLMLYYKALGKKTVLTAHNVNQGRRDSNDSLFNRITLRIQYAASRSCICSYTQNEGRAHTAVRCFLSIGDGYQPSD